MMKHTEEPEKLHKDTPQWFKDWYGRTFWHFQFRVENTLSWHGKLLWVLIGIILAAAVASFVVGR